MPEVPAAAPRNAIGGQVCGVAAGAVALAALGLLHRHGGVAGGMSGARVGAVGVSLLLATALMFLFKVSHPAGGATALMISLGIVIAPSQWLELLGAVVLGYAPLPDFLLQWWLFLHLPALPPGLQ